jgi:hypothetical protein
MSFTLIHRKNGLEEKLLEKEGNKSLQGPAKGVAGMAPTAEGRRVVVGWRERDEVGEE